MKRLVETSEGWIELDFELDSDKGFTVWAVAFDRTGWRSVENIWESESDESLENFLAAFAGVSADEATEIAHESIAQWRARGGDIRQQEENDGNSGRWLVVAVALLVGFVCLIPLALLALLVILMINLT